MNHNVTRVSGQARTMLKTDVSAYDEFPQKRARLQVSPTISQKTFENPARFKDLYRLEDFIGPSDDADAHVMAHPDRPWLFPGLGSNIALISRLANGKEVLSSSSPKLERSTLWKHIVKISLRNKS